MPEKQIATTGTTEKSPLELALRKVSSRFPGMRADAELRFAQEVQFMLAHAKRNTDLQLCTVDSMQDALLQAASFGLSLNPTLGHCYLIPRRTKRGDPNAPVIAYASPGYRGLLARATDSGAILWAHSDVVYQKDAFKYRGTGQEPQHDYDVFKPRGPIVGAYVFVKTLDGSYLTEWMGVDEIENVRKRSEFPKSLMWRKGDDAKGGFYQEGCKKAVVRRAWKRWPRKAQEFLAPLVEQLNRYEGAIVDRGEAEVVVSDDQVTQLHALLTDGGLASDDADKWLHRAAQTQGVARIQDLSGSQFDKVGSMLEKQLRNRPRKEGT